MRNSAAPLMLAGLAACAGPAKNPDVPEHLPPHEAPALALPGAQAPASQPGTPIDFDALTFGGSQPLTPEEQLDRAFARVEQRDPFLSPDRMSDAAVRLYMSEQRYSITEPGEVAEFLGSVFASAAASKWGH